MPTKTASLLAGIACALVGWGSPASAAGAGVVLNEVNCTGTDWVELVNTGVEQAEVGGWLLTDDPLDRAPPRADHRHAIPAATTLAPLGALVIERGATGLPFGISCSDDTIRLADASGALIDATGLERVEPESDTWGRYPSGSGPWMQTAPTPGGPNAPSEGDPPADPAAWLFDPMQVVEIDLAIPPASREALRADPDEYVDASFSLAAAGGTYGPLAVGVRLKGSASFRTLEGKAAFKIAFDERFLGLRRLTLNKMVQDPSMLHEALAFEVHREAGIASPRTGYAYVRVDGDDYGLYSNIETPDRVMLPRWFASTTHLYEGNAAPTSSPRARRDSRSTRATRTTARTSPRLDCGGQCPGELLHQARPRRRLGADGRILGDPEVPRPVGRLRGGRRLRAEQLLPPQRRRRPLPDAPWGLDQTFDARIPFVGEQGILSPAASAEAACAAPVYRAEVFALPQPRRRSGSTPRPNRSRRYSPPGRSWTRVASSRRRRSPRASRPRAGSSPSGRPT